MSKEINGDFEKIENVLGMLGEEGERFASKRHIDTSRIYLLHNAASERSFYRKRVLSWQFAVAVLLVINLTQGLYILRVMKKPSDRQLSVRQPAVTETAHYLEGFVPNDKEVPVLTAYNTFIAEQSQENLLKTKEGIEKILELQQLFEMFTVDFSVQNTGGDNGEV